MARAKKPNAKSQALAQDGVLNPHPEAVHDALFAGNLFFDAKDLVQVRYEMVRRHQVDGVAISEAAATFGVTRPTFYKAQSALRTAGLVGLLPSRRGPKGGHKISAEVIAFVIDLKAASPELTTSQCLDAIEARFGVKVHRRSLERALARKKKTTQSSLIVAPAGATDRYEKLRSAVLRADFTACPGLGVLRRRGLAAWMRALGQEPHSAAACCDHRLASSDPPDPSPATSDLTRLIAGILVAIAMEPVHA